MLENITRGEQLKGAIDCKTDFTLSQLNNDSSVGKMDIQ